MQNETPTSLLLVNLHARIESDLGAFCREIVNMNETGILQNGKIRTAAKELVEHGFEGNESRTIVITMVRNAAVKYVAG